MVITNISRLFMLRVPVTQKTHPLIILTRLFSDCNVIIITISELVDYKNVFLSKWPAFASSNRQNHNRPSFDNGINVQLLWKNLIKSTIYERQISLGIICEVNLSAALHLVCNICSQRSLFYETASPGRPTPPSKCWCLSRHNCDCAASRAHPPFIPQQSSALWLWAHSLFCLPWSIFEQISPGFSSAVGAGKLILTMFTFPHLNN